MRIFSQAIADSTDPAKVNSIGNESDSPSRELARFTQQVGDRYQQTFTVNSCSEPTGSCAAVTTDPSRKSPTWET